MNELKPCPFCGKKPQMWFSMDDNYKTQLQIYCNCGAKIKVFKKIDFISSENPGYSFIALEREAKEKWNRRI